MDPMQVAVDVGREALLVTVKLSFPVLAVGLVVGLFVSILQTATQIQEQTLAFIPKMFVVVLTLFIIMPWLLAVLVEYTEDLLLDMINWFE
jgi:flagellar biosynthetic protein FliQ